MQVYRTNSIVHIFVYLFPEYIENKKIGTKGEIVFFLLFRPGECSKFFIALFL